MAKQLNIFVENRPGRLKSVTEILFQKGINVITFTIQDRGDFGLMKLLVDTPEEAHSVLTEKGFACAMKDVVAVSIADKPGNLYRLMQVLFDHQINVVDTYGFILQPSKRGVCCIETNNVAAIKELVEKEGYTVLELNELYS